MYNDDYIGPEKYFVFSRARCVTVHRHIFHVQKQLRRFSPSLAVFIFNYNRDENGEQSSNLSNPTAHRSLQTE